MLRHIAVAIALALACAIAFGGALSSDFVNFDDDTYVYENAYVKQGLTAEGLRAAFCQTTGSIYQPLTILSLMLDAELWGLDPAGFHLTNLLLHILCGFLLYLFLFLVTDAFGRSAMVALLFAIHPLRVESVVWVTERKDVLSGVFFMLTLICWQRYLRAPRARSYVLVVLAFTLGLLTKPILVVLPVLLLLLDWWPLGRWRSASPDGSTASLGRLVREKVPLLVLSLAFGLVALLAVSASGSAAGFQQVGLDSRLANAALSYVRYMGMWLWPSDLAVLYPHPRDGMSGWQVLGASIILGSITGLAIQQAKQRRYLIVGWLWYCIALLPVSGIAQAGSHAMADRFTYLSQIGTTFAAVYLVADLAERRLSILGRRSLLAGLGLLSVGLFTALSWNQTRFWKDSEALYRHALAGGAQHHFIYNNLGLALMEKGELDAASRSFQRAIELHPDDAKAIMNLGLVAARAHRHREAIALFRKAIRLAPEMADAYDNLAISLYLVGDLEQAWQRVIQCFERGGAPHPDFLRALSRSEPPPAEALPWLNGREARE
ncbi:MAG: tetratricopeptide repeat protein [Deltaproteobacteria bacterium]|nr:tetratricopeptide repeat protein [Deltaproteobacteria bacterium]